MKLDLLYNMGSLRDFLNLIRSVNKELIRGVLLYTDTDELLASYIKENFQEFHKLSGDWCKIFIL